MESRPLRELRAAMISGEFSPAYYIHGEDDYRKDELVRRLTSSVVDAATRDFNLDLFRGADVEAERVESLLRTPPMMAVRRAVIVRDTGSLKKDARATLERYLERPSPDSVLVLVALAGTREESALASRAVPVAVDPLKGDALLAWLGSHAASLGVELSAAAAAALVDAVGADSLQLTVELDKLASFAQGEAITVDTVQAIVGVRSGESLGDLLDHVGARDLPRALAAVEPVLGQPRTTAVSVIMALTVQTLALAWGVHARQRGLAPHRVQNEYFTLLKETGAFPMRQWGEATRAWSRNLGRWDRGTVSTALRALRSADQAAKDTRVSSDEQLLSTLLCAMCATPAAVPAAR